MSKSFIYKITLMALSAWFWTTALVDFIAVPTVFRTIDSIVEAGRVGITIFSYYNLFEIFFAAILLFAAFTFSQQKWGKIILVWCLILFIQVLFYKFYITKQIAEAALTMQTLDVLGAEYGRLADLRQFYHQLYVNLDKFKLISILVLQIKFFRTKIGETV